MEALIAIAAVTLVGLLALWISARSAITVCLCDVKNGKLEVVRGALAPRVLDDLRDVVRKPRVKYATIRVVRAKDRARVEAKGDLTKDQLQQLRNVIGTVPLAQIRGVRAGK
jgi:hypothetical protein